MQAKSFVFLWAVANFSGKASHCCKDMIVFVATDIYHLFHRWSSAFILMISYWYQCCGSYLHHDAGYSLHGRALFNKYLGMRRGRLDWLLQFLGALYCIASRVQQCITSMQETPPCSSSAVPPATASPSATQAIKQACADLPLTEALP